MISESDTLSKLAIALALAAITGVGLRQTIRHLPLLRRDKWTERRNTRMAIVATAAIAVAVAPTLGALLFSDSETWWRIALIFVLMLDLIAAGTTAIVWYGYRLTGADEVRRDEE